MTSTLAANVAEPQASRVDAAPACFEVRGGEHGLGLDDWLKQVALDRMSDGGSA